ncbi:MAG: hypothetical protein LBL52_04320 [Rickettsiales bacterium]|nr:hypothetical protein [Rickettsiales bacterium]
MTNKIRTGGGSSYSLSLLTILAAAAFVPLGVLAQSRAEKLKALVSECESFNKTAPQEFKIPYCNGLSFDALQSALESAQDKIETIEREKREAEAAGRKAREDAETDKVNLSALNNLRDMVALYDLFDAIYAIPRYAENPKMQEVNKLLDGDITIDAARVAIYDAILSLSGKSANCGDYFYDYPYDGGTAMQAMVNGETKGSGGGISMGSQVCPYIILTLDDKSSTGYSVRAQDGSTKWSGFAKVPASNYSSCRYMKGTSGDVHAEYIFSQYRTINMSSMPSRFTKTCLDKLKNGEKF